MLQRLASIIIALVVLGTTLPSFAQTNTKGVEFNTQSSNPCGASMSCLYATSTGVKALSTAADGATAIALYVNTSTGWVNAAARLVSLATNSAEKFYVLADGTVRTAAISPITTLASGLGSSSAVWTTVYARHYASSQAADPSCTPGAAMGTGGSVGCTCAGTDTAMACTFVMGAAGVNSGTWATITQNTATSVPQTCVMSAGTAATATSAVGYTVALNHAAATTTTQQVDSGSAPVAGATYYFNIHCHEAL